MTAAGSGRRARVVAFPRAGTSYTESLYAAAQALGAEVIEGAWSARSLLGELRTGDVVHLHWPSFLYYFPGARSRTTVELARFLALLRVVRARGARVAWTAHNLYPHDGGLEEWTHRVARAAVVAQAEVIFVHGPSAAAEVAREFAVKEDRLVLVPHGHWIGRYPSAISREEARSLLDVPPGSFVYAFVGLCKPYKGLDALADAFAAQRDGAFLVVAGRFPSADYRALVAAHLARLDPSRVRFVPEFVPDDQIQRYLVAADALVLPYRRILTSGMAIVGLSFGRPVVAPRLGGLPDVVDERCGLLYDPSRPEALASAMDRVRELPFSERAILDHARSFRWEDAARALLDVANR